jgi:serine/threonine-protein kinase
LQRVTQPIRVGRYAIHSVIANGGMASVHFGTITGAGGFARTVAVKRMHRHLANDPEFLAMFVDEARLAGRIRHPNVVATLDVLAASDELLIVMDYVHGESLAELGRLSAARKARMPAPIACAVIADVLSGLHAAHETTDDQGKPLGIVHRDVGPENVLVGADGVARVADFGVARASGRLQVTREGQVKGKIAYMAPEQVRGGVVSRSADVYGASVVLWEILTGRRLFEGERDAQLVERILYGAIEAPIAVAPSVPEPLNAIVLRGLARDPEARFATAREMIDALAGAIRAASASEVSDWVESIAGEKLAERARMLAAIDRSRDAGETSSLPRDAPPAADAVTTQSPDVANLATVRLAGPVDAAKRRQVRHVVVPALVLAALCGVGVAFARFAVAPSAAPGMMRRLGARDAAGVVVSSPTGSDAERAGPSALEPAPLPPSVVPDPTPAPSANRASEPTQPRLRRVAPSPARASSPDACDPPYTTDADGTRHYKLKCL